MRAYRQKYFNSFNDYISHVSICIIILRQLKVQYGMKQMICRDNSDIFIPYVLEK